LKDQRDARLLGFLAVAIDEQYFPRGGEAKQEAKRLYWEELKKYLPRSVRKNP
jgi:hypothetical protein